MAKTSAPSLFAVLKDRREIQTPIRVHATRGDLAVVRQAHEKITLVVGSAVPNRGRRRLQRADVQRSRRSRDHSNDATHAREDPFREKGTIGTSGAEARIGDRWAGCTSW